MEQRGLGMAVRSFASTSPESLLHGVQLELDKGKLERAYSLNPSDTLGT
jgi:hypothetical protein